MAQRRVVEALWSKARALRELGQYGRSAEVWSEAIELLELKDGSAVANLLAAARLDQALALLGGDRSEEAVAALERLDRDLPVERSVRVRRVEAQALAVRAWALQHAARSAEAREVNEELVRRFDGTQDEKLRGTFARALENVADCHLREGRIHDAIEVGDRLVALFESNENAEGRAALAPVLLRHARSLLGTRRSGVLAFAEGTVRGVSRGIGLLRSVRSMTAPPPTKR